MSSSSTIRCIHCVKKVSLPRRNASCFHANHLKLYGRKKRLIYAWCLCSLWSARPHMQLFLCCAETDFMTAVNSVGLGMHFKHFHVKRIFNKRLLSGIWIRKLLLPGMLFFCSGNQICLTGVKTPQRSFLKYGQHIFPAQSRASGGVFVTKGKT